jgi:hypothetical protein
LRSSQSVCVDPTGLPVLNLGRGNGRYSDASSVLPPSAAGASGSAAADFDGNGRKDLFLTGPGGVRVLLLGQ